MSMLSAVASTAAAAVAVACTQPAAAAWSWSHPGRGMARSGRRSSHCHTPPPPSRAPGRPRVPLRGALHRLLLPGHGCTQAGGWREAARLELLPPPSRAAVSSTPSSSPSPPRRASSRAPADICRPLYAPATDVATACLTKGTKRQKVNQSFRMDIFFCFWRLTRLGFWIFTSISQKEHIS